MESAIARREKILEILSERRYEKMTNLAQELKVTRRTIVSDIAILSERFPIYTDTATPVEASPWATPSWTCPGTPSTA